MLLNQTALVVVDMENGFVNDRSRHIVAPLTQVVDRWQRAGGATIFSRFLNAPGSPYERLIGWSRLRTAPETDLIPELQPHLKNGVQLDKPFYTVFSDEGEQLVRQGGWTDLVFCGIATESCVLKSAVDAFERGYTPWVLVDACASHGGQEAHEAGLLVAGRFIGRQQLIHSADLFASLQRVA